MRVQAMTRNPTPHKPKRVFPRPCQHPAGHRTTWRSDRTGFCSRCGLERKPKPRPVKTVERSLGEMMHEKKQREIQEKRR